MSQLTDLQLNRFLYKTQPQTLETQGSDVVASNIAPPPSNLVASGNTVIDINTNAMTINGSQLTPGTIPQTTLDIANWGWTQTSAFAVVDSTHVSWGAGTFTSASGTNVYSISGGITGNMTQKTYVYLDINVSTTAYQVSSVQTDAIGIGKVLIAVAQNGGGGATYVLVQATQIVADNIIANTIGAQQLSTAILYAGTITLDVNGQIKGGMASYNSGSGFFLGYSGGQYKFAVGDSSGNVMTWDGSNLSIIGTISSTSSGQRVVLSGTSAFYYNASGTLIVGTTASSNSFLIEGQQTTSAIVLTPGSSSGVIFSSGGTGKIIYSPSGNSLSPVTDGDTELGEPTFSWGRLYVYEAVVKDILTYRTVSQPIIYTGKVSGTSISQSNTTGWSVTNPSTGIYLITHNLSNTNYNIQITAQATTAKIWSMYNHGADSINVRIADFTGTLENNDFAFQLALNV